MNIDEDTALREILMCVANKLGIDNWSYHLNKTNGDAVNFLGTLIAVVLMDDRSGESTHLVIKRAPQCPELEVLISEAYNREVNVYTMLMPLFRRLDTGIDYEKLFPKCYYAVASVENRLLVMNDMRTLGFVNHTGKYFDKDHIGVSLKAIASFHALSMILSEKNIKPSNNHVIRPMMSKDPEFYFSTLNYCVHKYYNALFKNSAESSFLVKLINNFPAHMDDSSSKAKKLVYGHGDLWKENILFEYTDNKPVGASLVDYQITRLMSPAQDVLFLLMNGIDSSTRRQHFTTFLSNYYDELQNTLYSNGLDPKLVYPKEDFYYDLKLVFPYCFIIVFMSYAVWLGFEDLQSVFLQFEKDIPKGQRKQMEEEFIKNIEDLIADFKCLGYIDEKIK